MIPVLRLPRQMLCALLLISSLSACTTWRTESVTPAQLVDGEHPKSVRVTRTDGRHVTIFTPRVAGDSLVGSGSSYGQGAHLGVALADIREIATSHPSAGKDVGLVLLVGVVAFGVLLVAFVAGGGMGSVGGGY